MHYNVIKSIFGNPLLLYTHGRDKAKLLCLFCFSGEFSGSARVLKSVSGEMGPEKQDTENSFAKYT